MTNKASQIKNYDTILQKHIDKKDIVKIFRTFNEKEENITGFILAMSKDFLLLQPVNDFLMNEGYVIIRKDQFDSLRCNKYEQTQKKIIKAEGIFDNTYGIDENINLTNWQTIFKDLKKIDHHVIVECEDKEDADFIIGPIKQITKNKVSIQYFDTTGQLDKYYTPVNYNEITTLKFNDNYSKTFRKYLKRSTAAK